MEPSPQQWGSTPSSLLWAHEIRRENIHLADEIHKVKVNFTSTVDTLNDLKQNINELSRQVKQAEANASEHLKCLESRLLDGSNDLLKRVETLEIENGRFKEELKDVRRECAARSRELSLLLKTMKSEVMNEVRAILTQERGALPFTKLLGGTHGNGDMARVRSDVLVPDSLPKDVNPSTQERGDSLQALSETTWGPSRSSSIEGRRSIELGLSNGMILQGQENLHRLFRQNGRPLGAYWSYAIDTRIRIPLWVKNSDVAKAFVNGLEDTATRGLIERKLYAAGWSWDVLADIMHNKLNERKSQTANLPVRMKAALGETGEASKHNTSLKHMKKKKRRVIPIVPADEDDLLEMNS
ncbi:hypothetical protein AARAC_011247 [Aspergillus arachidicola]|uniref:Uncharacterized protein n=1 Tax=Aspergillus arachidicola TaxID=656916 RepID=A0A2G7FLQ4_9EURO|nr:hypothetical protein AARAC_011247 [Aspergillus arachidicola]